MLGQEVDLCFRAFRIWDQEGYCGGVSERVNNYGFSAFGMKEPGAGGFTCLISILHLGARGAPWTRGERANVDLGQSGLKMMRDTADVGAMGLIPRLLFRGFDTKESDRYKLRILYHMGINLLEMQ